MDEYLRHLLKFLRDLADPHGGVTIPLIVNGKLKHIGVYHFWCSYSMEHAAIISGIRAKKKHEKQ